MHFYFCCSCPIHRAILGDVVVVRFIGRWMWHGTSATLDITRLWEDAGQVPRLSDRDGSLRVWAHGRKRKRGMALSE